MFSKPFQQRNLNQLIFLLTKIPLIFSMKQNWSENWKFSRIRAVKTQEKSQNPQKNLISPKVCCNSSKKSFFSLTKNCKNQLISLTFIRKDRSKTLISKIKSTLKTNSQKIRRVLSNSLQEWNSIPTWTGFSQVKWTTSYTKAKEPK